MSHTDRTAALLQFEQQLRQAETDQQLRYIIVNQLRLVVPHQQAFLLCGREAAALNVAACSDMSAVERTSPLIAWLERAARVGNSSPWGREPHELTVSELPAEMADDWTSFGMAEVLWLPLWVPGDNTRREGVLWLNRDAPWTEQEKGLLAHCAQSIAHALYARRRTDWLSGMRQVIKARRVWAVIVLLILALMLVRVPQSVLAPAEVVPVDPVVITSGLNGVVEEITVQPDQMVQPGDLLVRFEQRELLSELEVARQALSVAEAQLRAVQQGGFLDSRQNARLAELEAEVRLKRSQADHAQARFDKTLLQAPAAGLVILNDPAEWRGKPLAVGERILQLADPEQVQIRILLPVNDAITLRQGAEVSLFLDVNPLTAYSASLRHAAHEPELSPEGILSYRVMARFDGEQSAPRIGLRGTARIQDQKVSLFFYLFRRPITSLRQTLGW